jgi:hypothetical protein
MVPQSCPVPLVHRKSTDRARTMNFIDAVVSLLLCVLDEVILFEVIGRPC